MLDFLLELLFGRGPPRKPIRRGGQAEPCLVVFGDRGSGKSESLKHELRRLAREGKVTTLVLDRPGTLARSMTAWSCRDGAKARTFYEHAARTDRTLCWPFLRRSTNPDPMQARIEDELSVEQFLQAPWNKAGKKGGQDNPWKKQYMEAASWVYLKLPEQPPIDKLLKLFEPESAEHRWMLATSVDRAAVRTFQEVELRGERSPNQYAIETSPAKRMLERLGSPVIWRRHGPSTFWRDALLGKWQVYFDLSGVTAEDARFLSIYAYTAAVNECKRLFRETRRTHALVIVLEEAGALDLVTPFIITTLQENRKDGVSVWPVSQTVEDFSDQAVLEQLLALCEVHRWHRMNSGIERASRDLADVAFDPHAVHYTRTRQVPDGHEEVKIRNRNTSSGTSKEVPMDPFKEKGRKREDEREGESEGTTFLPRYREVTDEFYKSPQLQQQEFATAIANLRVGESFIRDKAGVRRHADKLMGEAWSSSIASLKLRQIIEEMLRRPQYTEARPWGIPAASEDSSSSAPTSGDDASNFLVGGDGSS